VKHVRDIAAAPPGPLGRKANGSANRVLVVAPSLDILGGQAVQAARLLSRLRGEPSISVGFLPINPRLPGPLRVLQRVKYVRTLVTLPYYLVLLLATVRRYDVIHIFSASYLSFVLSPTPAILTARLFRRRAILNYHSGEAADHFVRWRRTAIPTVRLADAVVAPSGYLVDVFSALGIEACAIPNFVDLDVFVCRERRPLRPIFLSNRNFEPLYNVACTIDAFALIQQNIADAFLILAGDGSDRAALEARVRRHGLRNVTFLGKVRPEDMSAVYRGADIFLNSPDIDNMPISIIEAFASGLPVVTSDAGGIPYFVEHERTGLIFAKGDHVGMAEQALRLLRDETLAQELIGNALAECGRYRWSAVRQQWLELYNGS
jgi:L-malate glycosyltransferase